MPQENDPLRKEWLDYVKKKLPIAFIELTDVALPAYRRYLREKYDNDIGRLNEKHLAGYAGFGDVRIPVETPRQGKGEGTVYADLEEFIANEAEPAHLKLRSLEFMYRDFLRNKYGDIGALNSAHEFGLPSLDALALPEKMPEDNIVFQRDWLHFVRQIADIELVYADVPALMPFRNFLTAPFVEKDAEGERRVDFDALNSAYGTDFSDEQDIGLYRTPPAQSELRAQWRNFLNEACAPGLLRVDASKAAGAWADFISKKYATHEKLNQAYGLIYDDFDHVVLPIEQADYFAFLRNKAHIRWEFIVRNYRIVIDFMLLSGRAILNTVIYCSMAVIAALLVNPLAAYALSRYKPPSAYKILLFAMLTMAFPPMVLGIPQFLLIRRLFLLNTYWALVLPTVAHGYSIFLLKGFFDSLPRELYESAALDGASEWTMFWSITMATSKPILAVIGLWTFTAAYGNFMMAFILCQNPKMWTMMVNVYQLMQRFSPSVGYAAVVVAAIPTFLIFIFCQNIIIRGIVVPTEK